MSAYDLWQQEEGIPITRGSYVADLYSLEVRPWARTGQKGAFVNLADQQHDDAYVLEIAPGESTRPLHHLFEATIHILTGRGATTIWQEGMPRQTIEWQRGSLFSPPLNCSYQHFNLDGQQPARLFAVTNAPMVMNCFRNPDFVFNNGYVFDDRYRGEPDYFTSPGEFTPPRDWKTNFVADLRSFKLQVTNVRGAGASNAFFYMSANQMVAHMSEFPRGTYKKAHRHGPGAHVTILDGVGYSLLWFPGEQPRKVDWEDGSVISPKQGEFHQHFNIGPRAARYLALRLGELNTSRDYGEPSLSSREGGTQIEYEDEEPWIYEQYVEECAKRGSEVVLARPRYTAST